MALAVAIAGCAAAPTRTVTVQSPSTRTATTAAGGADVLSRQDTARIARARIALGDYCDAVDRGRRPDDSAEVAAIVVLVTVFERHPAAVFSSSDPALALAEVLKSQADDLQGGCDPKAAKLLRNTVDVVLNEPAP